MTIRRGARSWPRVVTGAVALGIVSVGLAAPASTAATAPAPPVGGERLGSSGVVVDAPGSTPLPDLGAAAWVLADLDTGEVLAARDPHGLYRPASTLKILTALTVMPELDPATIYTAQWEDANAEGSKVGLVPDATYSVHNLLEALFLVSGNDAAWALGNAAGGVDATVARMNQVARSLGALDTTAKNPSGLDAPGQFTSAYDLAVITRAAMAREDLRAYVATVKSAFPGEMPRPGKVRKTYEIYTQDRLLLNYRGAIGVKTGYTTKARGTFVGAATRGGRTLVATVLKTEDDAWRESAALLTWGFRNAGLVRPVGTLDAVPAAAAEGARSGGTGNSPTVAATTSAAGPGGGLPWWLEVPIVLLGVVVSLRARVLIRRRWRAVRRPGAVGRTPARTPARGPARAPGRTVALPTQPRVRRRATSPVAAAPTTAPSTAARPLPPPLPEVDTSTGTGS